MGKGNVRAVGLLVLVSVVLAGAGQLFSSPANAALSAQVGMMEAAVYAGSCANPAPVPFALLNGLAPAGPSDNTATPLFSITEAPVRLDDLLASPHAILVSLGGDVDALLACGDLSDASQDGVVSVDLREENASGYAGVALLTAAGETTQVSIVLAATPRRAPIAASPASRGPATPVAIVTPKPATPAGGIPPIVLPPTVTPPNVTPPVGEPPAGTEGSPYVSKPFGYSIAFADPWRIVSGPEVDASSDFVEFSDATSLVDVLGLAQSLTPSTCIDRIYQNVLLQVPGLVLVVPHVGGEATVSTPQEAVEVWDFSFIANNGQQNDNTFYARCLVLEPNQSVLLITQESPQSAYPAEAALREELLKGLALPQ